jgi:S1-C subfamily serine protease
LGVSGWARGRPGAAHTESPAGVHTIAAMELIVDIVLVVAALLAVFAGWRRGALVTAASLAGIAVGAWIATIVAPLVVNGLAGIGWNTTVLRTIAAGIVLVVCMTVAVAVLSLVASLVRRAIGGIGVIRGLDSLGGAVLGLASWAVVVWLLAGFLLTTGLIPATQLVRSSNIVAALDSVSPVPSTTALGALDSALGSAGFPRVFADGAESIAGAQAPDPTIPGAVQAASAGVVRVLSSAPNCTSDSEGSGWVVATDRVLTNAHVVAGGDQAYVQVGGTGQLREADVVVYDPERDLAVLAVPGLGIAPLPLGTDLGAADPAVVAGYPQNGPYSTVPARIRQVTNADGLDIYGQKPVAREIYSLRGTVLPGNSGGPLFDDAGSVVGVVFARSTIDSDTGYAMTLDEIAPVVAEAGATTAVSAGACAAG